MARRAPGKLEAIAKILKGVYPAPARLEEAKVFSWWSRSVPTRIVKHARPVRLSRGVLTVHVTSSVWANELHYLSDDLLTRVRGAAPDSGIRRIRFQVGPLPELPTSQREECLPPEPVRLAALPEELGRALSRVQDDDLRKVIAEAATTSLARLRRGRESD